VEHLRDSLRNLPSSASETPAESISARSSARHKRVWAVLVQCFGQNLLTSYGETCPALWCARIDELEDWEIKRGLDRLSKAPSAFPPTLGQFWDACKQSDGQPKPVDPNAALRLIRETPARNGLPAGMSPICYQRAADIEAGRFPLIDNMHISPGSLAPEHWRQYQAGQYPNAEQHMAYREANPKEVAEWMDYRRRHWGNRYGFGADGCTRIGEGA